MKIRLIRLRDLGLLIAALPWIAGVIGPPEIDPLELEYGFYISCAGLVIAFLGSIRFKW